MASELPHDISHEVPSDMRPGGARRLFVGVLLSWLGVLISWLLLNKDAGALGRICHAGSGCDAVLSSRYASLAGVPLPWLGMGFYLLIFSLLAVSIGAAKASWRSAALGAALWMSVAAVTFSMLLMGIQFGVLRAFCPLCTASAVVILALCVTLMKAEAAAGEPESRRAALALAGMAICTVAALALSQGGRREEIVAIVDGQQFTRSQMEEELALDFQPLEQRRHALEAEWVGRKVDGAVLAAEAQRQGTTPDGLLAKQMGSVPAPTPKEIEARLAASGRAATAENSAAAAAELTAEKRKAAREALLDKVAGRHQVQVFLPPPKVRALKIDLATAQISGPADAAVKLVVFSDFQCQFCARLAPVLQRIRADFPDEVMVAFRHFPLEAHPRAVPAAVAAECAAEQGAFWKYHDRLFADGGDLSDRRLLALALEIGLDAERFRECLEGDRARKLVESSRRDAADAGLEGAPILFLNGRRVEGPLDHAALAARIRAELQRLRGKTDGR